MHSAGSTASAAATANGALTLQDVSNAEETMAPLKEDAKRYTAHCVGHAHIDMNWMWGYNETASLTVDTFRTVLKLMAEYPDFCFSQSQPPACFHNSGGLWPAFTYSTRRVA